MEEKRSRVGETKYISDDILCSILSRLPAKTLIRFRCVCKRWCSSLTYDPSFIYQHLAAHTTPNQSLCYILASEAREKDSQDDLILLLEKKKKKKKKSCCDEEEEDDGQLPFLLSTMDQTWLPPQATQLKMRIAPSCNGLILVYNRDNAHVCNPTTREVVTLPTTGFTKSICNLDMCLLGFNPSTREYKVLRMVVYASSKEYHDPRLRLGRIRIPVFSCKILTLGSSSSSSSTMSWRRVSIKQPPILETYLDNILSSLNDHTKSPASLNGKMYWMVSRPHSRVLAFFRRRRTDLAGIEYPVIVSFHVGDEKFSLIPCPHSGIDMSVTATASEMGGNLWVAGRESYKHLVIDLWLLIKKEKEDEEEEYEWIKKYSIDLHPIVESPPIFVPDGMFIHLLTPVIQDGILLLRDLYNCYLYSYNLDSGEFTPIYSKKVTRFQISKHVESLVAIAN